MFVGMYSDIDDTQALLRHGDRVLAILVLRGLLC